MQFQYNWFPDLLNIMSERGINRANVEAGWQFRVRFGSEGRGDGQFNYPMGIVVSAARAV